MSDADIGAARIAVLVARSSVVRRGGVAPLAYTLGQSSVLAVEELAPQLALLPKPLYLKAELRDGTLRLQASALAEQPDRAALHERVLRRRAEERPLAFLAQRFGKGFDYDQIGVTCHGAGELIQVTVGAFGVWQRDYHHEGPYGYGADFADSGYPAAQAVSLGAEFGGPAFVNFGWADEHHVVHWHSDMNDGPHPTGAA